MVNICANCGYDEIVHGYPYVNCKRFKPQSQDKSVVVLNNRKPDARKGIFDTTDLEKEISKIREGCGEKTEDEEFDLDCGEDFENINSDSGASFILCDKCRERLKELETTLKERQRLGDIVKKVIDKTEEDCIQASKSWSKAQIFEELKNKLGLGK